MAPIRTAIIGLSANSSSGWAAHAHLPYFLSPVGRAKFEIVALLNSSIASAEHSIKHFNLPAETRAYGSPKDLAADPDVQLVVCSTRVDKHYETSLPSLKAGKDVFVEWPLAENAIKAGELAKAAKEAGVRTAIGLQGWYIPTTLKLKELIASGRIGKVLNSEVRAARFASERAVIPSSVKYLTERKVGGNFVTIGFGHLFDLAQNVLGDVQNIQSRLQLQLPTITVKDMQSGKSLGTVETDVPDLIHLTGTLPGTEHIVKDATLHVRYRRDNNFAGDPALVWTIAGEKGEIRLTSVSKGLLQASTLEDVTIEVDEYGKEGPQLVEFQWDSFSELPLLARCYASVYEAYANGDIGKYADFDYAHKRHIQLDEMLKNWDFGH